MKPDHDKRLLDVTVGRRAFLRLGGTLGAAMALPAAMPTVGRQAGLQQRWATPEPFELDELTVAQLQGTMEPGQQTARSLAELYLRHADEVDAGGPAIHAIIERNPDALADADALDNERRARGPRGP